MRTLCFFLAVINASLTCTASSNAQDKPQLETALRSDPRQKAAALLPPPQGLQDHVAGGKLVLALDEFATSISSQRKIDIFIFWRPEIGAGQRWQPQNPRLTRCKFVEGLSVGGRERVFNTRLLLKRPARRRSSNQRSERQELFSRRFERPWRERRD